MRSKDYNFPIGEELLDKICKNLQVDGERGWGPILEGFGIEADEVKNFSKKLNDAPLD